MLKPPNETNLISILIECDNDWEDALVGGLSPDDKGHYFTGMFANNTKFDLWYNSSIGLVASDLAQCADWLDRNSLL